MGKLAAVLLVLLAGACERPKDGAPPPLGEIDPVSLPVIEAQLGHAPEAAPPVKRDHPAKVVVKLEVREVVKELADGVTYTFWTYGGSVPGPMIRVRRGDFIELQLANHPDNTMPHNIDLHAVVGPGGGASSTFTAPGHQTQFTFRALHTGVYVYHCATAPVGMHIGNGMYGLIAVEPESGWPATDREYYVMQGEVYTHGAFHEPGLQPFDMDRAIREDAPYVVFNGRDGALVGDRALTASVGERVRLFVGNAGPNLTSSFHVIGEIFDTVYPESAREPLHDVQTTLIPAGGSAMTEFRVEVPGTFVLVDHSIFRAFNKGTLAMLKVSGAENARIYSGQEIDEVYLGEHSDQATAAIEKAKSESSSGETLEARMSRGKAVFMGTCSTCHQLSGQGLPSVFPPLAKSDFLMADPTRSIHIVLTGLSGEVVVNGREYNNVMPSLAHFTDHEIADVLTFVRNSFGNQGAPIAPEQVAAVRASLPKPGPAGHP
jgi:nitrite reductase (NO-forming)